MFTMCHFYHESPHPRPLSKVDRGGSVLSPISIWRGAGGEDLYALASFMSLSPFSTA